MAKAKKDTPKSEKEKAASTGRKAASKATAAAKKSAAAKPKTATAATKKSVAAKSAGAKKTTKTSTATATKTASASKTPKAKKPTAVAKQSKAATTTVRPTRPEAESLPISREEFRQIEEHGRELPLDYGDTKIVLLVRDPEWIFAYWELSPEVRKNYRLTPGEQGRNLALRVHELQSGSPREPYDIMVNNHTTSWYVRVPSGAQRFKVEIGVFDEQGNFSSIATSNEAAIPRIGLSDDSDMEFAEIDDEIYGQILHLSGGVQVSERLGSDEFLRSLQQRIFDSLLGGPFSSAGLQSSGALSSWGVSSDAFSGQLSSATLSSFNLPAAGGEDTVQRMRQVKEDFWLEVGVDVIVYGATEPDAKVRFMGQDVTLNPDGTFRFRMVFPDGTIEFPVEAVSKDGKHHRSATPVVTRTTKGDPRKPS